jgi:hypothetical protein
MQCQLVCVDPARVHAVWPHVDALIRAAMVRADIGKLEPVRDAVLQGRSLLWLAWDGTRIAAAAVTELAQTEKRKFCVIVACGGADMSRWLDLLKPIEAFAKLEGCDAMRIIGREGWARVLPGYARTRAVIDKPL